MIELEIMCYCTWCCSDNLGGLFEIHKPTQMDKGGKFLPMHSMKLDSITFHHGAGRSLGQDIFKMNGEKWLV